MDRREYYRQNREHILAGQAAYRARQKAAGRRDPGSRRKRAHKLICDVRQAVPCADCGGSFPACAMDFDHRPGEGKVQEVSALAKGRNTAALLAEIDRCDVVCSNCHRVRTVERAHA